MPRFATLRCLFFCWPIAAGLIGCNKAAIDAHVPPPPEVLVSTPLDREVTDYEDFTGRTEAENTVEIRARVNGYLKKVYFKDGDLVKKGDLLFQVDPRPYQADVNKNKAALQQAETRLARLNQDFARARTLVGTRAMSREDYDKVAGDRNEALDAASSAKAILDNSQLYLKWTEVRAPINGLLSRRMIDEGNMVKADETALTTVISLDPIYVYFDVDERTLLRLRTENDEENGVQVELGLANEGNRYPHTGTINFQDNRVDSGTGTIRMRGVFKNPKPADRPRLLSPGLFARIRLPVGKPYRTLLVAERAISTDQGKKFVYLVTSKQEPNGTATQYVVERRDIEVGSLHKGGLRAVKALKKTGQPPQEKIVGLAPTDLVVVSGLQRIRPKMEVNPRREDMPEEKNGGQSPEVRIGQRPAN
jgi:RND family efflux transporter MFP subunit